MDVDCANRWSSPVTGWLLFMFMSSGTGETRRGQASHEPSSRSQLVHNRFTATDPQLIGTRTIGCLPSDLSRVQGFCRGLWHCSRYLKVPNTTRSTHASVGSYWRSWRSVHPIGAQLVSPFLHLLLHPPCSSASLLLSLLSLSLHCSYPPSETVSPICERSGLLLWLLYLW